MTIKHRIQGHEKDIGGFSVRRLLPSIEQRCLGPVVFMDHMGPAQLGPGVRMDVRPHPHINLATMTWLFDGCIMHKDSLEVVQEIRPGAINWMTAGKGIVHSERSLESDTDKTVPLHGIQTWIALPKDKEEVDPSFEHYKAEDIPAFEENGVKVTVIAGEYQGHTSPVNLYSPMIYLELRATQEAEYTLPVTATDIGLYVVEGELTYGGETYSRQNLLVPETVASLALKLSAGSLVMVIGGESFPEKRHMWWNFVSSSKERIEQAKDDWRHKRFDMVPGDERFIPLPEDA